MIAGVLISAMSAFMQSIAFIFSRRFVFKYQAPWKLLVYSQLLMAIFGLAMLLILLPQNEFCFSWQILCFMLLFGFCNCLNGLCFFLSLRDIEASRMSSLLGLKLLVLMPFTMLISGKLPGIFQIIAVILATISAVGMNFTGGRLRLRGIIFLTITLICASTTDIAAASLTGLINSGSRTVDSLIATSLSFIAAGALSSLVFLRSDFEWQCFRDAIPYSLIWFLAMVMLFFSFTLIGVMLGTIIQSGRGLISVLLGMLLLKIGWDKLEPRVSAAAWIRRAIMSILMILSMYFYTIK